MKAQELRLGQKVTFAFSNGKKSIPMIVTGIFTTLSDINNDDCDVYLNFEGNEGDVWEVRASELSLADSFANKK